MIGLIGGSGAGQFNELEHAKSLKIETPYGTPSADILEGILYGQPVCFLSRHGPGHKIPPHKVNYRANIWALNQAGAKRLVALNAVGSISAGMKPTDLAMPDQIIDYTWGREHSFFDGGENGVDHVDFSVPYDNQIRRNLVEAARQVEVTCHSPCVYGATQGPRLESAAEIVRMERDGSDVVGMTGMPEAGLAREIGLPYASICIVANLAAGKADGALSIDEIFKQLEQGVENARKVFRKFVENNKINSN
ncbi:MAG: 5'-methylthioinosine phosphorylase [Parasphingorhabdus sp.]|jgi:5'-methylthioinosine phosphorylase